MFKHVLIAPLVFVLGNIAGFVFFGGPIALQSDSKPEPTPEPTFGQTVSYIDTIFRSGEYFFKVEKGEYSKPRIVEFSGKDCKSIYFRMETIYDTWCTLKCIGYITNGSPIYWTSIRSKDQRYFIDLTGPLKIEDSCGKVKPNCFDDYDRDKREDYTANYETNILEIVTKRQAAGNLEKALVHLRKLCNSPKDLF